MVADRKFYYPITDDFHPCATDKDKYWRTGPFRYLNASPWKVIGPAGTVDMETNEPYVGKHTPAIHLPGWRRDVVELLKQLDSPVYRWPGGNFVSGYNWRDGIGDRDQRPPRKNPAWKGVESNDVGSDETMQLMSLIGAEPYVALNTGLGGADEAANEVQYFNGAKDTPMGRLRAQNGHPKPYGVKYWAVGNEMFGNWQLGHMPLSEYVKKNNQVVDAIWQMDPRHNSWPSAASATGAGPCWRTVGIT
jgi:alpha-L-arabinofuranosidase